MVKAARVTKPEPNNTIANGRTVQPLAMEPTEQSQPMANGTSVDRATMSLAEPNVTSENGRAVQSTFSTQNETSKPMANGGPKIDFEVTVPKAHIGLFGAVAFGIGTMIGSGIFISPTGALKFSGSIGASLIIWAVCGLMTLVTGLVYAELGTIFPQSGGDFIYIKNGLGEFPAFLAVWVIPLFSDTAAMTVMALAFSEYLVVWISGACVLPMYINRFISALMIITICVTNSNSAKFSTVIQIICTSAKMCVLLVISVSGIALQFGGASILPADCFVGAYGDVKSYCLALYSCMFAYGGFTRIGDIADEIINPRVNIPKAVIISVSSVTIVYVISNVAFFSVLSMDEILNSNAVVYDWSLRVISVAVPFIQIGVLLSIYGTCNGDTFGASRVMFAAARADQFPEVLSFLNIDSSVPVVAILVVQTICCGWLLFGDILSLINFLSFMSTIVALLSTISLVKIRYQNYKKGIQDSDVFRTPIILPFLNIIICCFMIITPFIDTPRMEFVYGICVLACGVVFYVLFIRFKLKVPGIDRLTIFCQLMLRLGPPKKVV